jgi:xanthine dehydrogenase large subunit
MINIDALNHVKGKSIYLDDIPEISGTLYCLPFYAETAHGRIKDVNIQAAKQLSGISAIFLAEDIPGANQIGGIIPDEPLFAVNEIHYWGQPIGLIVGVSEHICRKARKLIRISFDELPVITCPREAQKLNHLIVPPRKFKIGQIDKAWSECDYIIEGTADINGQEHLYIETQGAYAWPKEGGSLYVASSTQGPTAVQRTIATVLDLPMHKIEVNVVRLGGGFGGKEDQATMWAVMAALAAQKLNKPVKISLHRMDDMCMTGKRHPYSSDFRIGLTKSLKIMAYEVIHYQNAGASADLSPAILERTLFHSTNAYYIPNVEATAWSCKTNLPPNTAFRGFGGPQGKFVIEAAIVKAAESIGVNPDDIQKANLVDNGDEFPYGQVIENAEAKHSWEECDLAFKLDEIKHKVEIFNGSNVRYKKGYAVQPICFGISFTNTMMNHARALVHIYQDGSVVISTGAVEMGQGVNTKLLQIATEIFGISPEKVRLESTNTLRIANTSPTAASAGADLNGKALEIACNTLKNRLIQVAESNFGNKEIIFCHDQIKTTDNKNQISWTALILLAFQKRVSLSEHAHYATPVIHYDKTKEKGHPFAYHVYGTAILEVTVDCLKGTFQFDSVKIVHDFGNSMNTEVDNGQIEGGLVQGIGWMTMEEILYNEKGKLISNALSTYKVPDIYSIPNEIIIRHLETIGPELAIKKSKAVGEPPLMYGLGAYFAIRKAVKAFNPSAHLAFDAPYTPEKVLMDLYRRNK